jgi:hypothetical protein
LNVGSKCIKPDLSSKFTLLSMFMHNGWFSTLGATSPWVFVVVQQPWCWRELPFVTCVKCFLFRDPPALDSG